MQTLACWMVLCHTASVLPSSSTKAGPGGRGWNWEVVARIALSSSLGIDVGISGVVEIPTQAHGSSML